MEQAEKMSAYAKATARQSSLCSTTRAKTGGKGIRTPDFQLAKLALYQLSYAPCELSILDCASRIANVREHTNLPAEDYSSKKATFFQPQHRRHQRFRQKLKPDGDLTNRHPAFVRFFERAKLRSCARKAVLLALIAQ